MVKRGCESVFKALHVDSKSLFKGILWAAVFKFLEVIQDRGIAFLFDQVSHSQGGYAVRWIIRGYCSSSVILMTLFQPDLPVLTFLHDRLYWSLKMIFPWHSPS